MSLSPMLSRRVRSPRPAAVATAALTLGVLLAGCGGGDKPDVTGDAGSGPATTVEGGAGPGGSAAPLGPAPSSDVPPDTSGADLTPDQLAGVTDAYLRFVAIADRAGLGDPEAGRALEAIADRGAIDVVDNARRANEQLKPDGAATSGRVSTANMATITGNPQAVVIADCLATSADRDVLSLTSLQFVDQLTTLRLDGDAWKVARVEVRNDGTLGSGRATSCAPLADRQRLTTSVTELMKALDELWTDPAQPTPPAVTDHVDPSFVEVITADQSAAAAAGQYLDAPAEHQVSVLGSDLTASGPAWVVGVCSLYPEGLTPLSTATGQPSGPAILAPGTAVYREFGVRSETGSSGAVVDRIYEGRRIDPASDCGDRS